MIKRYLTKNFLALSFSLAAAFVAGSFLYMLIALRNVRTSTVILHFNDVSGITVLGSKGGLVFMGVFGLVSLLINFGLAREFTGRNAFLGQLIAWVSLAFGILLFIAFLAMINVNR